MQQNSGFIAEESLPFFLQSLNKQIIFISKNHSLLEDLAQNLSFLECNALLLCPRFSFHINHSGLNNEYFLKHYINAFEHQPQVVLLHSSLLSMPMPEPDSYSYKILKKGDEISTTDLSKLFIDFGYTNVSTVNNSSEFAIRGYIVDFSSFDELYRIEFYGNKVDAIKTFNPSTQKSRNHVESITIYPNNFLLPSLCNFKKFPARYQILTQNTNEELFFAIENHPESCDINKYTKMLIDKTVNIADLLSGDVLLHNASIENITHSKEIQFFENQYNISNGAFYFTQKEIEDTLLKHKIEPIMTL